MSSRSRNVWVKINTVMAMGGLLGLIFILAYCGVQVIR